MEEKVAALNQQFLNASPEELLAWFGSAYPGEIAFSTSMGAEDQVITHMIGSAKLPVRIFTLDTGRLFQETYDLLDITRKKYGIDIDVWFPEASSVEGMVNKFGINLFYDNFENRRLCCHIRKKEPLTRALAGMKVWVTGMRQEQSVTRSTNNMIEWDAQLRIMKVNPLIYWEEESVWSYIREQRIPVNELHQKGYPSIGCQPCTRQVKPGEDVRSGRWWWELPEFKECGLHKKD